LERESTETKEFNIILAEMKHYRIYFDLDGVVVDTAKYHYLAGKKLPIKLGFEFTIDQTNFFKGLAEKDV